MKGRHRGSAEPAFVITLIDWLTTFISMSARMLIWNCKPRCTSTISTLKNFSVCNYALQSGVIEDSGLALKHQRQNGTENMLL